MAGGYKFAPLNVRAVYQNDGSAKSSFLAEVERMTTDAGRMFKDFSNEARNQLDAALAVKRNSTGSLDLGVDELRAAAAAQQARATAAREVAAATALAAQEEGDYSQKARLAIAATQALAIEEEKAAATARAHAQAAEQVQERLNRQASATDLVVAATRRGTSESANVINGIRAQRAAYGQLGQQLQDVVVQTQMGTSATVIFTQQVPQMAFALSGLADSANKTQARIGQVASFLAGPWGAAIFAATAIIGPLIANLLSSGDAADKAAKAAMRLGDGMDFASMSVSQLTQSIRELEAAQRKQIQTSYQAEAASLADAEASLKAARATREKTKSLLEGFLASQRGSAGQGTGGVATSGIGLLAESTRQQLADLDKASATAEKLVRETRIPIERRAVTAATDAAAASTLKYDKAVGSLNQRYAEGKITLDAYRAGIRAVEVQKNKEDDSRKKGRKGADPAKEAERVARAAQRPGEFGEDAGKKIANIGDSFRDIPPEVERINKASRELDDIISDLMNRRPEGFRELVDQAQGLKDALPDMAFGRVMRQITEDAQQQVQYQMLILQGRDGEAQALQQIYQIEQNLGPLRRDQKDEIISTGIAMQRVNEQMQRAQEIQAVFLDSTRAVRGEVEAILGGYGSIGDLASTLRRSFQQIQGKVLTEQIFGDMFRDMDQWVKGKTGSNSAAMKMEKETLRAGDAAKVMADELLNAASRISGFGGGTASSGIVAGASTASPWLNMRIPDSLRLPGYDLDPNGPLNVTAPIKKDGDRDLTDLTPEEYFRRMGQEVGQKWASFLEPLLGKKFAGNLGGVLGGVLEGQATTGTGFGAILGGLKELKGLPKGITDKLGGAFTGAQTGAKIAGIGNALGLKLSNTGSQVGGALGSLTGIPGADIIGSIAGGLLGKLFKKVTSGYAQVRNGDIAGTYGRTGQLQNDAREAASGLIDTISSLSKTLGTTLGNYDFDFGKKNDRYVVNTGVRGTFDFASEQEAMEFAVREAVADGAFVGLSEGAKRLLQRSGDLEAQVQKAVSFQNVFKQLKSIKDPLGAALDELNNEFTGLIDIFKEAGASTAEYASLEELYGLKRADAIKQVNDAVASSLKGLLDELRIGSDYFSLRDRKSSALEVYNPLKDRVAAGDTTAFEAFSEAARNLISIEREISGSTSPFFALLQEVTTLSQNALTGQNASISAASASDSPFAALAAQNASTVSAIDNQTSALVGRLDLLNANLIAALRNQSVQTVSANTNTQSLAVGGYW